MTRHEHTDYETLLVERRNRVVLVTLNRPDALNALNEQVMRELVAVVTANDEDPAVSVTVITGSERAFAAGADIKEMADLDAATMAATNGLGEWDRIASARKPLIAAVAGHALGGGCELALMCDLVIAADNAKFGQPEIKLGVIPGMGGSQRLTRAIGKARAMDLILTGRSIGADDALAWGVVSRVVPVAALLDEALAVAAEIAEKSLPVVIAAKAAVNQSLEGPLADGIRFERSTFHSLFDLHDQKEGMRAFIQKRKPDFQHR